MLTLESVQQQHNVLYSSIMVRNFPHVHIKASLKLRKNIDGVVDVVVKVRAGVESIRASLEKKVCQELEQLLR